MKIYVCSSWKNEIYPTMLEFLRRNCHCDVWDWRNPPSGDRGFSWSEIDEKWQSWTVSSYKSGLATKRAWHGFLLDKHGIDTADKVILLLPSGRSSHLEAGYAVGNGKPLAIFMPEGEGADLMYKFAQLITNDWSELGGWILK